MDPTVVALVVRLVAQYGPEALKRLRELFSGGAISEEEIRKRLAMPTAEEVQAQALSGALDKTWTERKKLLDFQRGSVATIYFLITAQMALKSGSVPPAEAEKAKAANASAGSAYVAAHQAMKAGSVDAYNAEASKVRDALAELARIKVQYCPFLAD